VPRRRLQGANVIVSADIISNPSLKIRATEYYIKIMVSTFFSWKFSWRRVARVSVAAVIALGIVGCLLWYFFLYLPLVRHFSENQKVNEKIRQDAYEMKLLYPTSSFPKP
jgi:hypothetical protein